MSAPSARQVAEEYVDAYNERDVDRIEAVLAPEIETEGSVIDRDTLLGAIESYWTAFPDCRHDVHRYLAVDGHVTVHTRFSGTHEGEYHGYEPTGESFDVTEMMLFRIPDGEIRSYWYAWDELGFWEQLGVLEHPLRL